MSAEPAPRLERRHVELGLTMEELASTALVRVIGEIDLASVHRLMDAFDQVDLGRITLLVFDLDEVGFLDLAALRAILHINGECENHGVHFTVIAPRGLASRVFTLTDAHLEVDLVGAAVDAGR